MMVKETSKTTNFQAYLFYNTIIILGKNETTKLKACFFHKMLSYNNIILINKVTHG